MIADFCSLVKANREGENRGKEKRINPRATQGKATTSLARRGQGGDFVPFSPPLAGCRDSVPAGAWGNAPTVGRLTYSKGKVKHGTLVAGSEASLRTNSRSRRSGIPQQHKKSTMKMCIRSNPEGDRRLRLFSLPPCRLRRGETLCNTKINLLKPTKPQTSLPFAPRRIFPMQKIPRLSHNRRRKLMQTLLEK